MNRVIFKDGHIVKIKSYFIHRPGHIEFYTEEGDHYIYISCVATVGELKYRVHEFYRRIMTVEGGCPDPYSIEYIIDDNVDHISLMRSEK